MLFMMKRGAGRATAAIFASALVTCGLSVATAGPASAAESDCPGEALCWFDPDNYGNNANGGVVAYDYLNDGRFPSGTCFPMRAEFNDLTSSIVNNTQRNIVIYQHGNCQGSSLIVKPWERIPDLASRGFDNMVSSAKV